MTEPPSPQPHRATLQHLERGSWTWIDQATGETWPLSEADRRRLTASALADHLQRRAERRTKPARRRSR